MPTDATSAAVLAGMLALYGAFSVLITHALRRYFPIEGARARIVVGIVAGAFGLIAGAQIGATTILQLPPEQRMAAVIGLTAAIWWASQEFYRRLRVDLWGTRQDPWSKE